jgi:hypothetical protein
MTISRRSRAQQHAFALGYQLAQRRLLGELERLRDNFDVQVAELREHVIESRRILGLLRGVPGQDEGERPPVVIH